MKVSDAQFEKALRETGGMFSLASRYIEKNFGIQITRSSVRERALRKPELLQEIRETITDKAEAGIVGLMSSKNEGIKYKSCTYYLDRQGKDRGYGETPQALVNFDFSNLSEEEVDRLLEKHDKKEEE